MLNALASVPFLLALAGAGLLLWQMVAENAPKILAALRGQSLLAEARLVTRPVIVRYSPRQLPMRAPVRTVAQWRVAA